MLSRTPGSTVKIEDLLREEYFDLLPEIRKVVWQLEAEIRCKTLPILQELRSHEQLMVKSRVKDCESALKSLRRRQEGGTFERENGALYSLEQLPDLAGVRILVFPRSKLIQVDDALRQILPSWTPDPVSDDSGRVLAHKYSGYCPQVSERIRAEYQVVPMLIGLFWEVEHSALYKPTPTLKGKVESDPMKELNRDVIGALSRFELEFERLIEV